PTSGARLLAASRPHPPTGAHLRTRTTLRPNSPSGTHGAPSNPMPTLTSSNSRWPDARPWMTNAAFILFGFALVLLSRHLVAEYDHFTIGFSGVSGWSAVLYLASVFLVLTQPVDRFTFPIIL